MSPRATVASTTIARLPKAHRPRERLAALGPTNLTQAELLAILIGTGTIKHSAVQLAKLIVRQCGDRLHRVTSQQLTAMHGIGRIQAGKIIAAIELGKRLAQTTTKKPITTPQAVLNEVTSIRASHREHVLGLYLNARYELLQKITLTIGSFNANAIEPRDVFAPALKLPCAGVIIVHNHPSNDPEPSQTDQATTKRLQQAGELLGVTLLDHLIVTTDHFFSFQQHHWIDDETGKAGKIRAE